MLKYLFTVEFADGTQLRQTKEDRSELDPRRNTFYDVLHSKKKVKTFTLKRFLERYSVDLQTGRFRLNGVDVEPELVVDATGKELVVTDRQLVWFMNVKRHFNASYSTKTGNVTSLSNQLEERIYYFGWETTIEGQTYRRVIGIT